jgi:hypothetical protein
MKRINKPMAAVVVPIDIGPRPFLFEHFPPQMPVTAGEVIVMIQDLSTINRYIMKNFASSLINPQALAGRLKNGGGCFEEYH